MAVRSDGRGGHIVGHNYTCQAGVCGAKTKKPQQQQIELNCVVEVVITVLVQYEHGRNVMKYLYFSRHKLFIHLNYFDNFFLSNFLTWFLFFIQFSVIHLCCERTRFVVQKSVHTHTVRWQSRMDMPNKGAFVCLRTHFVVVAVVCLCMNESLAPCIGYPICTLIFLYKWASAHIVWPKCSVVVE